MVSDAPVDAVIMWVDGSSPDFVEAEQRYTEIERARGKRIVTATARHRNNGELRYVLRGLVQNAPWIRRIHVVTNGQVPDWLIFDGDRINHVRHDQIFPDPDMLPCFNSFAIESCLHRIPGLSETFLRLSDDFFIGQPADRQAILGEGGIGRFVFKGRVQEEPAARYQIQIRNNARIYEQVMGQRPRVNFAHAPQIRHRAVFDAFVQTFGPQIEATRRNRFRDIDDIIPLFLYPYFHIQTLDPAGFAGLIAEEPGRDFIVQTENQTEWYTQVKIGGEETNWRRALRQVAQKTPLFFNLNDSFAPATYDSEVAEMTAFLETVFPKPAAFERG